MISTMNQISMRTSKIWKFCEGSISKEIMNGTYRAIKSSKMKEQPSIAVLVFDSG